MKWIVSLFLIALFSSCEKTGDNTAVAASSASGTGGSLARFTIVGNTLYLADVSTLKSYDITDAKNVIEKSITYIRFGVETIFPYKDKLFIGSRDGMYIYSIKDPVNPVLLGEARHGRACDPVVANDTIAFVTLTGGSPCGPAEDGLYVHDIRDVLKPVLLKKEAVATPAGLGLSGDILYICQKTNGLSIYNIKNPAVPVFIKKLTGHYFSDVIPYNDLLICYVSNGLVLYNIADKKNPQEVAVILN
jgi:hypothetical protein